jgi:hypothetical protein
LVIGNCCDSGESTEVVSRRERSLPERLYQLKP